MKKVIIKKRKVDLSEIGTFIKLINLDYDPKNNKELAQLVSENFDVDCTTEDIEHYLELDAELSNFIPEDYELESRRHQFGVYF